MVSRELGPNIFVWTIYYYKDIKKMGLDLAQIDKYCLEYPSSPLGNCWILPERISNPSPHALICKIYYRPFHSNEKWKMKKKTVSNIPYITDMTFYWKYYGTCDV